MDYHERQYLGFNRHGILRRMVVAVFCFVFYFVSASKEGNATMFFYLGLIVLIFSMAAMMITHLETKIEGTKLTLIGTLTHRTVELDLKGMHSLEAVPFSRFMLNRPLFNLHRDGAIHFYTHGKLSVQFVTANGTIVKLGTQHQTMLYKALEGIMTAKKE